MNDTDDRLERLMIILGIVYCVAVILYGITVACHPHG
jgi:hypothetical protein